MTERDWNINKGFGDVLTALIEDVNAAAKAGDVKQWFNSLRILYRNVAGHKRMKKEAVKKLDDRLKNISKKLDKPKSVTEQGKAIQKQGMSKVKSELDEINIDLITQMHTAGLILPVYRKKAEYASLET